jgi:hypothetical protein
MSLGGISEVALCVYTLSMVRCLALFRHLPLHLSPLQALPLTLLHLGRWLHSWWHSNAKLCKKQRWTVWLQLSTHKLQYQWGQENRLGPAKTLVFVKVRTLGFVKCITLDFVGVYIGPLMSDFRNWVLDLFVAKFLRCMALMSF